jgi:hypothetical protein
MAWEKAEYEATVKYDAQAVEEVRDALRADLGCEIANNLSPAEVMWAAAKLWFPNEHRTD